MICKDCYIDLVWVRTTEDGSVDGRNQLEWFQCPECGHEEFIVSPIDDQPMDEAYWEALDG